MLLRLAFGQRASAAPSNRLALDHSKQTTSRKPQALGLTRDEHVVNKHLHGAAPGLRCPQRLGQRGDEDGLAARRRVQLPPVAGHGQRAAERRWLAARRATNGHGPTQRRDRREVGRRRGAQHPAGEGAHGRLSIASSACRRHTCLHAGGTLDAHLCRGRGRQQQQRRGCVERAGVRLERNASVRPHVCSSAQRRGVRRPWSRGCWQAGMCSS